MIPQNSSVYPVFLPATDKHPNSWINLCSIATLYRHPERPSYGVFFINGQSDIFPKEWGEIIENEFRLMEANRNYSPDETN